MTHDVLGSFGSVILAAASIGVWGCGGDTMRSTAAPTTTLAAAAAVLESHHGGNDGQNGDGNNGGNSGSDSNRQAEITGTAQAVTGACPVIHLTIAGRVVSTTASTEFKDVSCASLAVGQTVEATGTLQSDGSIAAIRVETATNDNKAEVNGAIAMSTGSCPTLSLTVGSTIVRTTAATVFHDAVCGSLPVGTVIEARGTKQPDGSVLASRVEREGAE